MYDSNHTEPVKIHDLGKGKLFAYIEPVPKLPIVDFSAYRPLKLRRLPRAVSNARSKKRKNFPKLAPAGNYRGGFSPPALHGPGAPAGKPS